MVFTMQGPSTPTDLLMAAITKIRVVVRALAHPIQPDQRVVYI